jgi:hypothetical protein
VIFRQGWVSIITPSVDLIEKCGVLGIVTWKAISRSGILPPGQSSSAGLKYRQVPETTNWPSGAATIAWMVTYLTLKKNFPARGSTTATWVYRSSRIPFWSKTTPYCKYWPGVKSKQRGVLRRASKGSRIGLAAANYYNELSNMIVNIDDQGQPSQKLIRSDNPAHKRRGGPLEPLSPGLQPSANLSKEAVQQPGPVRPRPLDLVQVAASEALALAPS